MYASSHYQRIKAGSQKHICFLSPLSHFIPRSLISAFQTTVLSNHLKLSLEITGILCHQILCPFPDCKTLHGPPCCCRHKIASAALRRPIGVTAAFPREKEQMFPYPKETPAAVLAS